MKASLLPMEANASVEFERFADFVREHDAYIRSIIRARTSSADFTDDCEDDIVQETFYQAFTHFDQLRDRTKIKPWLAAIARNRLRRYQVQTAARKRRETVISSQRPEVQSAGKEWVWGEIDELPPALAAVLRHRYLLNKSYAEIADEERLPISTVRGRIYEARLALRRRLIEKGLYP